MLRLERGHALLVALLGVHAEHVGRHGGRHEDQYLVCRLIYLHHGVPEDGCGLGVDAQVRDPPPEREDLDRPSLAADHLLPLQEVDDALYCALHTEHLGRGAVERAAQELHDGFLRVGVSGREHP